MIRRILVPLVGSPTANAGLDESVALAKPTAARLRLIHVEAIMRTRPVPVLLVRGAEAPSR